MRAAFPLVIVAALTSLVPHASTAAAETSSSLFSSYEVIALGLEAPFNDLFDHARTAAAYAVTGTLTYRDGGRDVVVEGVKVGVRGNTSRREAECAFPKLKVQLPAGAPSSGVLSGVTSLRIGTHCGESEGDRLTAKYGRLSNQQSPLREAFAYRLLEAVGVPTLKARPARVSYVYADARADQSPPQDQAIVRHAMLLEDSDEAVRRLGGVHDIDEKAFTNAQARFRPADTARIALAEAMIGNFDWCLKMTAADAYRCNARHPLWNIIAAVSADGQARPLMHDFDIAGSSSDTIRGSRRCSTRRLSPRDRRSRSKCWRRSSGPGRCSAARISMPRAPISSNGSRRPTARSPRPPSTPPANNGRRSISTPSTWRSDRTTRSTGRS
jgi:hypothetical protein